MEGPHGEAGHDLMDIYKNVPLGLLWLPTYCDNLAPLEFPPLCRLGQKRNVHIKTHSVIFYLIYCAQIASIVLQISHLKNINIKRSPSGSVGWMSDS